MAVRCREFNWAGTSLGPPSEWPEALRIIVAATMESPFAMNLWCGPDLNLIYNDAYSTVLGAKHPRALGRPGREVWSEIWSEIAPNLEAGWAQVRGNSRLDWSEARHAAKDAWDRVGPPIGARTEH